MSLCKLSVCKFLIFHKVTLNPPSAVLSKQLLHKVALKYFYSTTIFSSFWLMAGICMLWFYFWLGSTHQQLSIAGLILKSRGTFQIFATVINAESLRFCNWICNYRVDNPPVLECTGPGSCRILRHAIRNDHRSEHLDRNTRPHCRTWQNKLKWDEIKMKWDKG